MKTLKLLSLLLAFIMCVSILTGCGQSKTPQDSTQNTTSKETASDTSPEKVELEFWTINLKKNFSDYIGGIIAEYEASHPNTKIEWVDVPGADVTKKVITSLSSNDVPDVINETILGYATLKSYDVILPLSDYADASAFEPYIEGLIEPLTEGGKVMAIPWYSGGPFVGYINTEIYEKAGLDVNNPPRTIDELLENGRIIHEKVPGVYGSNDFPYIWYMEAEGLPIVSEDGKKAVFNSDEHVKFIQKFVDAYKNGSLAPGCIGKDDRNYQQKFNEGQTGQWGAWFAHDINNWQQNNPEIMDKIKVIPGIEGKKGPVPMKDIQLFFVPKRSEFPKEAVDLALFVTNEKNQLEFCKLVAIFGSVKGILDDPFFKEIPDDTLQNQARKIMVENAAKLSLNKVATLADSQQLMEIYNEEVRAAMTGAKSVKEALDAAVAAWEPILNK